MRGVSTATRRWGAFVAMRARYLLDTEEWTRRHRVAARASPTQPRPIFTYEFTNAFGAIRRGDLVSRARGARQDAGYARQTIEAAAASTADPAHAGMPGMNMPPPDAGALGRREILHDEIAAMIRHKEGASARGHRSAARGRRVRRHAAVRVRPAVHRQARVRAARRDPARDQPAEGRARGVREGAGAHAGTHAALVGLMKAAAQSGDRAKEAEIKARLQAIWHHADRKPTDWQ